MRRSKFFVLLLFLSGMAPGLAAQPRVSAALDSNRILIGDQVKLNIYVEHAADESIVGADYGVLKEMPQLEVLGASPWDTLRTGERFVLQQHLTLTSFDSGYYRIPPIPIQYLQKGGLPATINTNDLALTVDEVFMPGDSLALQPIKPIIEEPLKFSDFLPYLAVGLGILLAGGLIYFFLLRRNPVSSPAGKPQIVRPAHEVALEKLADLKTKKIWQQGAIKRYHSELTYIVREYIERRYQSPALESTTAEILRSLRSNALDDDLYHRLEALLQLADLVKFAKAEPPPDRHDQAMNEAVYFVEQTKWTAPPIEETTGRMEETKEEG